VAEVVAALWTEKTSETFSSVDVLNRRKIKQIRDFAEILIGSRGNMFRL
jgi:hypothetical protein